MARIVIIAETDCGQELASALRGAGHDVLGADTLADAVGDVIFIEPSRWMASDGPPEAPVIVLASGDGFAQAIEAVKTGAYDVLRVPCSADEAVLATSRALRWQQLVRENQALRVHAGRADTADTFAAARTLAGKPLADIEKHVILGTLEQFKGHRLRTAAALGIGVRTLGMKIKRWREEGETIAGRQPRPHVHAEMS